MTGYTPEPEYVPSPWLEDISDESAAILAQTLLDLAMACEDAMSGRCVATRNLSVPSSTIRTNLGCENPRNPTTTCTAMTKRRVPPILTRDNSTCFSLNQSGTMTSNYHAT